MSKISRHLSHKLSLGIMLLAAPLFVLSLGILYFQSRYLIRQEAIERSNSILKTTVQRINNYMSTVETSTKNNAWLIEENFRPDSLEAISQRIIRNNPNIISCSISTQPDIFPQYGHLFSVYTSREDGIITTVHETDYDYLSRSWYNQPVKTGKACWVGPFSEFTDGTVNPNETVATYSYPLYSPKGQILGVLSADFSFSLLAKRILSIEHPYPDAYFVLLGGDGRYFIHPDTTRLFRKTIFSDVDPQKNADLIALGHEMTEGKQGTMHVDVNGEHYHVNYHQVTGTQWSLAMVCPDGEILLGYHRLAYVIIALIIIGLLVMLWLCQRVVRQTIHPINELLGYTQLITDGQYNEKIPVTNLNDDIGLLQNSFAAMQQALHRHMGKISSTAKELRKRNEQRAHDMQLAEETVKRKALFIQNLSHQIRTPISIITGFANLIQERIALRRKSKADQDTFQKENLDEVSTMMKYNAIHLKRMILMLLDSSSTTGVEQLTNNRNDEVSCNEVARESINYTEEHFLGEKILFESNLPDAIRILTNHIYLMRTLRELLYNAAKYSDGKHICLRVSETNTHILFTIEDKGPGLPDNADDLMYKPFIKIDDLSEGLGLGLPLCKRHALSLGGDLIYDANYKEGCRFIVEMPK